MSDAGRYFCALESQKNNEEVFGTVATIRSWFLLEYPNAWRKHAIEDSRLFSPAVRAHLLGPQWDRALLIRQRYPQDCDDKLSAFLADSSPDSPSLSRHRFTDYEQVAQIAGPGEPVAAAIFAVCTHGRHDRCCAKFGMAVWCALREVTPDRAWQCSHVGGDRFAANVVLLPQGIFYGRVRPEDVADLVRSSDAGEIWMPGYRGRSCYGRAIQVGDYFLRRETGSLGFEDFRPVGKPLRHGDTTAVVFEARKDHLRHRIEYQTIQSSWQQRLTCDSSEASFVSQYRLLSLRAAESLD